MNRHYEGERGRGQMSRDVASGELPLGAGMTTVVLPVLLPYNCCARSGTDPRFGPVLRHCWECGAPGWTHNDYFDPPRYRCLNCATFLDPEVVARLREDI